MATSAGITAFKRTYSDPSAKGNLSGVVDMGGYQRRYALLWHYYNNSVFDELTRWTHYIAANRLYRHVRSLYNPARRLVDFYAGTVYPGMLTHDAENLPDGTTIAIPFTQSANHGLREAIGQIWRWSNWQTNKGVMVRYGAATGDVLVEIIDDVNRGKVYLDVRWPGMVTDFVLDSMGNVKSYVLEYEYEDRAVPDAPRMRRYKKTVDKQWFRTYRDDAPFGFEGNPAAWPNPYGFVPAVWIKHLDIGGDHGEPSLRNISKWDELNGLASHAIDHSHRVLQAPILVSGDNIQTLQTADEDRKPTGMHQRTDIPIIKGPAGADIRAVEPPPGENLEHIANLIKEVEADHPELTMWSNLRSMSQVTGPGISRLFGDVEIYVNDARASYDTQSIKMFQMAVAIAGMRLAEGDWGTDLNIGQQKFVDYDLTSYERGELDFEIGPRPLVPNGPWEAVQIQRAKVALENERVQAGPAEGDQVMQIAQRLRMRQPLEGVLQTQNAPTA